MGGREGDGTNKKRKVRRRTQLDKKLKLDSEPVDLFFGEIFSERSLSRFLSSKENIFVSVFDKKKFRKFDARPVSRCY